MFGKNKVSGLDRDREGSLVVNDLWYTIQGEGPDAGLPAVFLRLARCNLRCHFCDTEFDSGTQRDLDQLTQLVGRLFSTTAAKLLVITGGEPLLQNVIPLIRRVNQQGYPVSIETAGTVWLPGLEKLFAPDRSLNGNLIVCSPKTPRLASQLIPCIGALKYIVGANQITGADGLPSESTQMAGVRSYLFRPHEALHAAVYLQPMDEQHPQKNALNLEHAGSICMKYGYRLSVQMHKLANLP